MTFRGPGAHVRIELLLESQHDLEGSGGSENHRFVCVFLFFLFFVSDGPPDAARESFFRRFVS